MINPNAFLGFALDPKKVENLLADNGFDTNVFLFSSINEIPDRALNRLKENFDLTRWEQNIAEFARRSGIEIKKEGETPFSSLQADVRCRFIFGRFAAKQKLIEVSSGYEYYPISQIPFVSVENIPQDDRPLALWGVSQYAMLLLGSCPELLCRIRRLFDASPAKIGRSIKGMVIESSSELGTLTDDFILLIPKSIFLPQMLSLLPSTGFKGTVVEV